MHGERLDPTGVLDLTGLRVPCCLIFPPGCSTVLDKRHSFKREKDRAIAEQLKRCLSGISQLVDLKVLGSRARGDADEYSDLDVFIEIETVDPAFV